MSSFFTIDAHMRTIDMRCSLHRRGGKAAVSSHHVRSQFRRADRWIDSLPDIGTSEFLRDNVGNGGYVSDLYHGDALGILIAREHKKRSIRREISKS